MSHNSDISWTDDTWPIITGCDKLSPGCANCWAVRDAWRMASNPNPKISSVYQGLVHKHDNGLLDWTGVVRCNTERLDWPFHWRKPRTIFVCSSADLFHEDVPFEFIARVFHVMAVANQHRYILLTKRPHRALHFQSMLSMSIVDGKAVIVFNAGNESLVVGSASGDGGHWPPLNIAMGVSIENQYTADHRVPALISLELGATRWLSIEPMLGPISLTHWTQQTHPTNWLGSGKINAVVVGGESGPLNKVRPFQWEWAEDIECQLSPYNLRFHFKQTGSMLAHALGYQSRHGADPGEWPIGIARRDSIFA